MDAIDVSEWWAVLTNGEWFVGRRDGDTLTHLQKALIQSGIEQTERGARPATQFITMPWLVESLVIPKGALWIAIDALENRVGAAKMIASSEKLKLEARAQKVGIHLA
jgi:hypothetical protein